MESQDMSETSIRSSREVIQHHNTFVANGDLDAIAAGYTDDAVVITAAGVNRGRKAIRSFFQEILNDLHEAQATVTTMVFEDSLVYLEWRAIAGDRVIKDGVDTFVLSGDKIQAQTVRYTWTPKEPSLKWGPGNEFSNSRGSYK